MPIRNGNLPGAELDFSVMLPSWSMLGEEAGPMFPMSQDLNAADPLNTPHFHQLGRPYSPEGLRTLLQDSPVSLIQRDPELVDPPRLQGDAAVSEIEAQEIGVRGTIDLGAGT